MRSFALDKSSAIYAIYYDDLNRSLVYWVDHASTIFQATPRLKACRDRSSLALLRKFVKLSLMVTIDNANVPTSRLLIAAVYKEILENQS